MAKWSNFKNLKFWVWYVAGANRPYLKEQCCRTTSAMIMIYTLQNVKMIVFKTKL